MWLYHRVMSPNDADGMANSVDPDQSDQGLHCLPRHICPKTWDHYGNNLIRLLVQLKRNEAKFHMEPP